MAHDYVNALAHAIGECMFYMLLPVLAISIAVYCRFYIMRACVTFGLGRGKRRFAVDAGVAVVSGGIATLCMFVMPVALFVAHVIAFSLVVRAVDNALEFFGGEKRGRGYKTWKTLYGLGILPMIAATAFMLGGYINMHNVTATELTVYTQKSIRQSGYTVALIADVHYGISVDKTELGRICAEISASSPSMVVLCGDIVDENTTMQGMTEVFDAFGGISAEFGVFYVFGNHDRQLYAWDDRKFTEKELVQTIENSGITLLRDSTYSVNGEFTVVGREDAAYEGESVRTPIAELIKDVDRNDFLLMLDHQPRQYKESGEAGVDLLLSGHTHGGQIFPAGILFDLFGINDATYGYTKINETSQAFVTSGFAGWGFPVKTCAPAEYVLIEILPKNA